ncbi:MAG: asparagine synthase (glutamine-hydrolyzing) [Crocinitomicaceae bacterium]
MCGINGIYEFSGFKRSDDLIVKMNERLAQRGPDAEGVHRDEFVQFGHRRLSIIDVDERSNQPFKSADGKLVMVFNGEIYNYKEIKAQLSDYPFQTDSDTEVVLAAYQTWGEKCLRSFNGMFSIAIWNLEKKELFICRDRLGIKPLYYVLTDEEIIFSSSVRSILATGLIDKEIRKDSLVDYLRFQTVHAPYTLIDGIFQLMPGQSLTINETEGVVFKKYWGIVEDYRVSKDDLKTTQATIKSKLRESVERRMIADVPFGAFLSGGIDSSIIVGLMSEVQEQPVETFSIAFKEDEFNEAKFAREVAEKFKTKHHEIELSGNEFAELIPDALSNMDHPSGDGPNTYVVSRKTKEAGIKMALSGLGGDELFGGYSIFNQIGEIQQKKWLMSFPAYARKPLANLYHSFKGTVASSKIKAILKQEFNDMEFIYQFYRQVLMDDQVSKLMNTSNLPKNASFEIPHKLVGYGTDGWKLHPLSRISAAEISTYMQNVLLKDADQMSMAAALELRVPFLDHEFVEYVLGIPDYHKKPISPKKLLVDSFSDLLPENVYNRPKMGFVLPYEHWMKNELREFCEERIETVKNLKLLNANAVDSLWKQFLNGNKRVTWSRVWPLVVLGDWIKANEING